MVQVILGNIPVFPVLSLLVPGTVLQISGAGAIEIYVNYSFSVTV